MAKIGGVGRANFVAGFRGAFSLVQVEKVRTPERVNRCFRRVPTPLVRLRGCVAVVFVHSLLIESHISRSAKCGLGGFWAGSSLGAARQWQRYCSWVLHAPICNTSSHFTRLAPRLSAVRLRPFSIATEARWAAVRDRVQYPEAQRGGVPLSDADSSAELAMKRVIHRAAPSLPWVGVCKSGSDVTVSTDLLLTCSPGQGLSCSNECGGYFLSLAGYVRLPSHLRAHLPCLCLVLPVAGEAPVSLPTLFCFHRNVEAPPTVADGPLSVTKVGAAPESTILSFTWDRRAPTCPDLHGHMFLEAGTSLDRSPPPPLWVPGLGVITLNDPVVLPLAPWTQCMEPSVAGGAIGGGSLDSKPVVLVGLPSCFRGLSAKPMEEALKKINAGTNNGRLIRVIIDAFSHACSRQCVPAVALLDAVLTVLHAAPSESPEGALLLPADIGAALLALMEDELGLAVDEDARSMLLPPPLQERPMHLASGLDNATGSGGGSAVVFPRRCARVGKLKEGRCITTSLCTRAVAGPAEVWTCALTLWTCCLLQRRPRRSAADAGCGHESCTCKAPPPTHTLVCYAGYLHGVRAVFLRRPSLAPCACAARRAPRRAGLRGWAVGDRRRVCAARSRGGCVG